MSNRRNTELLLLMAGALPVLMLYATYVVGQGGQLTPVSLMVPAGLLVAFFIAHLAVRFLAPNADPAIMPIVFVLSGIGITFVRRLAPDSAVTQLMWLFLGVGMMVVVLALVRNLESLARYKYTIGIAALILLFLPAVIGTEHYGARLWIHVGGLSFQPGELAKVLMVIFLAAFLSQNRELLSVAVHRIGPIKVPRLRMLLPLLLMWVISLVIVVWERDLGSALIFFAIFVTMLFVATGRWFYPIVSVVLLAIGGVACYQLFGHVRQRIDIWLDPFADPSDAGYQLVQGFYSFADGGLSGVGVGNGMADVIPFVENDFIFAAIAEEMGLLGAAAVIMLYMLLCVRGFLTAARAKSDLAAFLAVGLVSSISFQAFVIIGGCTGLIPLTGVTLPFLSQGGSSLISSFIIIGLLLRCGDEGTGLQVEMANVDAQQVPSRRWLLATPESGVLGRRALSRRLAILTMVNTAMDAVLIANLAWLMIGRQQELRDYPGNSHELMRKAFNKRGSIVSHDGIVLAQSVQQSDGTYSRDYPQGELACHTVGYASTRYGSTGIEALYDPVLTGQTSYATWGDALLALSGEPAAGNDVVLTIHSAVQARAQELLAGRKGAIVVLDPRSGAVIAKASTPGYSPTELDGVMAGEAGSGVLFDRTVQALYTPGSTFKVVTLTAALESGVATLESIYDAPASLTIGGGTVTNYRDVDYGTLTLRDAFAVSSNTVFAQVATQMGAQALVDQARSFGYAKALGDGFSALPSLMPVPDQMTEWECAWAGAGQPVGQHESPAGPQTTVMQNAVVAAAIANGGVAMEPYVVEAVTSSAGVIVSTTSPRQIGRACSEAVASQVASAMLTTVVEGTGTAASIAGVDVAGKTGTAEKTGADPDAWFIGFAPFGDPRVAVSVVIEGDAEHSATAVAGAIISTALDAMGGA